MIFDRGEDFLKSLQTDDECQVMAIAHTGELKIKKKLSLVKFQICDRILFKTKIESM
jgi:hypothetical protein